MSSGDLLRGHAGFKGKSAYDIAVEMGFEGTKEEWLESLTDRSLINTEKTNRINADNNLQSQINGLASGSPLVASSVAEMTDTSKVYVNTTDGYWYYYNGNNWVSVGVYQSSVDSDAVENLEKNMEYVYEHESVSQKILELNYIGESTINEKIPVKFESGKTYEFNMSISAIDSSSNSSLALQLYKGETIITLIKTSGPRAETNNLQFVYECENSSDFDGIRLVLNATNEVNINLFIDKLNSTKVLKLDKGSTSTHVYANFDFKTSKGREYNLILIKEYRIPNNTFVIKLLKNLEDLTDNIQTIVRTSDGTISNTTRKLTFTADDDYNYIQVYATSVSNYSNRDSALPKYTLLYDTENEYLRESKYLATQSNDILNKLDSLYNEINSKYSNYYSGQRINLKQNTFDLNNYLTVMNYNSKSIQGLAIHGDYAFQIYDTGLCAIYNLQNKQLVNNFALGSNIGTNHCGNACFGTEYPSGNADFPALYVSGDLTNFCCYVENITLEGSELIQKIDFNAIQTNNYNGSAVCIDRIKEKMYYIQRVYSSISEANNIMRVKEFNLPSITDGESIDGVLTVRLTDNDVLRTFDLPKWQRMYQDSTIINGKLFQISGSSNSDILINVYDIENNIFESQIDLSDLISNSEPEGIDIYKNELYISFIDRKMYKVTV